MIKKNEWVQVHSVVLTSDQRAPQVPDDTKSVPLEMWVKGFLTEDAELGEMVTVKTVTGRLVEGKLIQVHPTFRHSFGEFVPEILEIDQTIRKELFGGDY
ncbi:2-amino-4-oxopentanoate thiolase subunit OrtA [Vagococcus hydrophili]|uniref:2-amino-4-ketopentanoate thiolase n=1 Tax=Vagococcus hydrophili TaxID=2714947 RepID=A0A6G8AXC4_9ENTE|nr:2-amino-4-oxopentanoate thiolase subunit OrtA [Vagococcus hydrophili]QIL49630.1 2-amino-4-ketopentanoate thiolase [Vagococcus hydrophili]